jgi:hypothetical protein
MLRGVTFFAQPIYMCHFEADDDLETGEMIITQFSFLVYCPWFCESQSHPMIGHTHFDSQSTENAPSYFIVVSKS